MTQFEQRIIQLITQVAVLINPISAILRLVGITTKETVPYHVQNQVDAIANQLNDPTHGLAALQTQLATFQATTALDFTAVLTAIGSPQQASTPVTLPATTPAGAWPTDAGTAASVWGTAAEFSPPTMYELVNDVGRSVLAVAEAGNWGPYSSPYFSTVGWDQTVGPGASGLTYPAPSADAILSTDTLTTWLTRELPTWTVHPGYWGSDAIAVYGDPGSGPLIHTCTLDDRTFSILKATLFPAAINLPPVWPGISGVTLGAAVALSDGLVVMGPLAGVLIVITSVPTPISYYPFGTIKSYVRAGAIVFTDDNGDSEFPQPFGPDNQCILPKSMTGATSATVRLPSGIVGTIQPFTIP